MSFLADRSAVSIGLGGIPSLRSGTGGLNPSLDLDFAVSKSLDPRITFTRASEARYYDASTVAVAEQNLLTYSQQFDNAAWGKTRANVTANSTTAPDGTATADSLIEDATANSTHYVAENLALTTGVPYTFTVYAKANTRSFVRLTWNSAAVASCYFNLSTGAVGTVTGSLSPTATITSVGSGWYRCSMTVTINSAASTSWIIATANADNSPSYSGDGTSGIYVWGAQLEQRSTVTAYTPTTTAAVTNYIPVLQVAANGVARFDHNPVTRESLGLLIEEQRTNLLLRSEEFDNAVWVKNDATVSVNAIVSPDGTVDAEKLVEGTANSLHFLHYVTTLASSTSYTLSVFAKAGERTRFQIAGSGSSWASYSNATFDLSAGTVVANTGAFTSASITPVGNGWYRCTVTGLSNAISTSQQVAQFLLVQSGTTVTYTGNGFSGIYIWGAQLEAGAFATSYIPTVASQVTRSADAASMTGTNFSSWYRQDEGTIYTEATTSAPSANTPHVYDVSDGTTSNFISSLYAAIDHFDVKTGGTYQCAIDAGTVTQGVQAKVCGTYRVNDFAACIGGAAVVADTSGVIPVVTNIRIGARNDGAANFNGTIKRLAYYPVRLANATLQSLTA